ncbi:MAG: hypothetical protein HZA04_07635 [Nitrospinae bacterium]|nr:hypothetical protein [Nitrospinota bacterium]
MSQLTKEDILREFELFSLGGGGIGNWLSNETNDDIFSRLSKVDVEPIKKVQFNQLLVLGHEAPASDDFFKYYWLTKPERHPYPVNQIPGYEDKWTSSDSILSISHLKWGLYRLYVDALLYHGNVRSGYRALRSLSMLELEQFFNEKRFETDLIKSRGPALGLETIARDKRYLISEMACKSFGDNAITESDIKNILKEAYSAHLGRGGGGISFGDLLKGEDIANKYAIRQVELNLSVSEVLDEIIESMEDLEKKYSILATEFVSARKKAIINTRRYLSMVGDLDVYIATSMRSRQDFRDMATKTEEIFGDTKLSTLSLRYFDPTLSAASGHEDKGLIECLMVKCAKVLVYCAGEKESYGKDAEAAMALSLGKPVIFLCDTSQKSKFYKDVHPLSRLIRFDTGVAVGAMVTDNIKDVAEILSRIFENKMEYVMEQPKKGYLRLHEKVTDSIVRLQTSDPLLAETFWNHYHGAY